MPAGKRKQACVKHSAVFAILLCLIVPFGFLGPAATSKAATIWQQLGTKTMPAWMEGVVADYLPNLTPWMPDVVPTSGNAALLVPAETDVRPALVLKAHTFDQETRSGTLLTVLKWVPSLIPNPHVPDAATAALPAILSANTPSACTSCTPPVSTLSETQTPLQLTSGRDVPKTAVWSPEKQLLQTLQATAMMIPGLQSVLLGVRDVTPPVPRSIRDVLSLMLHLMPGTVPGASVDSVGEVALAGWEQHAVLNGASFVHLVSRPALSPSLRSKQRYLVVEHLLRTTLTLPHLPHAKGSHVSDQYCNQCCM